MSYLGIEFGSTRIKAVEIDEKFAPVSSGDYTWTSEYKNGIWTYDIDNAIKGLKVALGGIKDIEAVEAVRQCVSALIDDISNSKPRTIAEWVERGEMPRTAND